jgi:NAD(P)-dependent dehydrogenase (short-subunit alcohol dehydrogenase family)
MRGGDRLIKAEGRIGLAPFPAICATRHSARSWSIGGGQGLGGLDIVVSNAGRQQTHASILDITTEDFDATMKTNIYAPFWIIKAALPHHEAGLGDHRHDSEQAYDPSPDLYDYAQTKAATMNYVKSLAKAAGAKGHPRERRRARADLDAACRSQRRRDTRKSSKVRRPDAAWPRRPAGRAGLDLCPARGRGRELRHRPGLWLRRRRSDMSRWRKTGRDRRRW